MNIEITHPEVEAIINRRLQSGAFRNAEDVILQALQSSPTRHHSPQLKGCKTVELKRPGEPPSHVTLAVR
jgi:hypothetical protein